MFDKDKFAQACADFEQAKAAIIVADRGVEDAEKALSFARNAQIEARNRLGASTRVLEAFIKGDK
jgi:hypothetical protein